MEAPLFTDANGDTIKDVYELPNGCLCCSAKDGLIGMLDVLLEQRDRFDYVLVEATGVADPESICEVFWVDEGLGSRVFLDGIVTLVDARNALSQLGKMKSSNQANDAAHLGLETEVTKQVACADVLILNKTDLAPEDERGRVAATLRSMNPTSRLLESKYSAVPLAEILGLQAFDRNRLAASIASLGNGEGHGEAHGDSHNTHSYGHSSGYSHGHSSGHSHGHSYGADDCDDCRIQGHLLSDHGIESVLLKSKEDILYDPDKVRSWLADVLWEGSAGFVYRCKGLFKGPSEEVDASSAGLSPVAHAVQGVGKLFDIEEVLGVAVPNSKLLFVGRELNRNALEAGLRACKIAS